MTMRAGIVLLTGLALFAAGTCESEIAEWRKQRVDRLKAEGGWLSLVGLSWLHEGANTFGKDASNDVVVPDGPAHAGVLELKAGKVTVKIEGQSGEKTVSIAGVTKQP